MAQIDTGLGWLAESDWLLQASNYELAKIGGYTGLCGPLQVGTTQSQVWQLGQTIATASDEYSDIPTKFASYNTNGDVYVAAQSAAGGYWFISPSPNTTVYGIRFRSSGQVYYDLGRSNLDSTYDRADGTRFYYMFWSAGWGTLDSSIPIYSDIASACNALVFSGDTFTKTNPGFAVACLAKWKTQNGTALISPILISSETDYTDMASSAAGHSLAKYNRLLAGVRFYMAFWDIPDTNLVTATTLPQLDLTNRGNITLDQLFMIIISTDNAHVTIINAPDPYENEGAGSGEEGGDGEETGDDDAGIEAGSDFPSAINTGFCRIFSPSESELRDLSNYLWSNSYDLAQVKKLFSNPMDSILGLSAVPIRLLGSSVSFSLGGVPITGMTLPLVQQQRYTYHMGTIAIKERWGSYLDYDPYTKFSIFLPFIGMRELSSDDIMGKTISLVYDIDILTGMCVARLQAGTNCLYEWGGNCAIQLPVNSRNWDSVFSTAVSAVGGIVSAVTGGSAPLVAGSVASAALQTISMKPRIDKSSTIGGAAGWLGQMTPYIIRTTPEAFIPTDQNKFIGYPAYINVDLANVKGYNEVESIHLENVTATGAELEEIESILKGGVIF